MATPEETAALRAKTVGIRGAHRSSATKYINQIEAAIEAGDTLRLRQLKQSLTDKRTVLAQFDDEVIGLTEEDQLETEVLQADEVKERMDLAILTIKDAISKGPSRRRSGTPRARTTSSSSSTSSTEGEGREGSERMVPTSTSVPTATTTTPTTVSVSASMLSVPAISMSVSGMSPSSTGGGGVSTYPMLSVSSTVTPPITPTGGLGFPATSSSLYSSAPLPTSMPASTLHYSTSLPSVGSTINPHSVVSVPSTGPTCTIPVTIPQVKLPKLSIKRFGGDLTKWLSFWDSFNSAIHLNPSLSSIDKFNYLKSLVESSAAEAIAGLTITSANYDEAIATLQKRFGNTQLIVNRHMEALLGISAVSSHLDIKGLRKLHDTVETHVRGLRTLGIEAASYGNLLTSVLINKLPSELRLMVSREITTDRWDLDGVMKILEREVEARERASMTSSSVVSRKSQPRVATGATLLAGSGNNNPNCVYCGQSHASASCTTTVDVTARKDILRRTGRCFICLRKNHLSRDCRSSFRCQTCRGRHHSSICLRRSSGTETGTGRMSVIPQTPGNVTPSENSTVPSTPTSSMYVGAQTPILLQTAQMKIVNSESREVRLVVRGILDSGSQRTYITSRVRDQLNLPRQGTEFLRIKTFGTEEVRDTSCDVVELSIAVDRDEILKLKALVVPFICNPLTSQPINSSGRTYEHLVGLELADSAEFPDVLEIDVLIGSDSYWRLVTGDVIRGDSGPTAIHSRLGWILSGTTDQLEVAVNLTLTSAHTLKVEACLSSESALESHLKRFWNLESLGIAAEEAPVYEKFIQRIKFDGQRYEVCLPWRECHPPLHDHYELCLKRLMSLLRRLKYTPTLLTEYNSIIQDQLEKGIIEVVSETLPTSSDRTHYLPHHPVVRQDKSTTKLRIVYDASAKSAGPSLNECLYAGPKFGQSIFDIVLRFRVQQVALAGDIEKAFLMLSMCEEDRDSLRFLWVKDPQASPPHIIIFRFTRVMFGVSSSPFLLNATIKHHMETYRKTDGQFVDKFLSSIYVDDLVSGSSSVPATFEFYEKSKQRLAVAGFRLRKFITNSEELRQLISQDESRDEDGGERTGQHLMEQGAMDEPPEDVNNEDLSYAKSSLGITNGQQSGIHKILGVEWDIVSDDFRCDLVEVIEAMEKSDPTKRSMVSATAKFFDPLGIISPVIVTFKILCQQLCEAKVDWDEPLTGEFLKQWDYLVAVLKEAKVITIPRLLCPSTACFIQAAKLVGFCDASLRAYAAVIYLRTETSDNQVDVKFVASKTRVTPVEGMTIPRLELLSALVLSRLMDTVQTALEPELQLSDSVCFTDSKVALFWIQGTSHEWKQFVENRVRAIRNIVAPHQWRHCPGRENPADIPSRGMSAKDLADNPVWLHGPDWIRDEEEWPDEPRQTLSVPQECTREMKGEATQLLVSMKESNDPDLAAIIDIKRFSTAYRLFKVTGIVLKAVRRFRELVRPAPSSSSSDMSDVQEAKLYWIKHCQSSQLKDSRFAQWKRQLDLFEDEFGVWRCGGRMSKSCLSMSAKNPILLDKNHHLTQLLVIDAHLRVLHNGVKETLSEFRSEYWLIKGRQFVRKLLHTCVTCKKHEGKPCHGNPPPPLPNFRVQPSRPFQTTGVDFAGPLYVRTTGTGTCKTWMCLYTCCTTRAVHLDLVRDMTTDTFLRSFRRFTVRRGVPSRVISDNGKTFKYAAKLIKQLLESPEAEKYFSQLRVEWKFNLEKAPWWGGIFERMIKSAKRCLRKSVGKRCLSFDELYTLIVEVEAVLNSRPLTYVASDDIEEPLTPSHLLVGYRILTLPDPPAIEEDNVVNSQEQLTRRANHLARALQHFWNRWKKEYLLELRELHRICEKKGTTYHVREGDLVTIYDEGHPRGLWRLGKIEALIQGADGVTRGVRVRVVSKRGHPKCLHRPLQHIYPLEVRHELEEGESSKAQEITPMESSPHSCHPTEEITASPQPQRPVRNAAVHARDRILGYSIQDSGIDSVEHPVQQGECMDC